jgi:hypothetical protein
VRQDFSELGRRALATLVDMVDFGTPSGLTLRSTVLAVRRRTQYRYTGGRWR